MKKIQKEQGFTLIELLVVVSIIGLLASITLVSLNTARAKARDASRQANIQQLMTALELYYDSNGEYPLSGGATSPNVGWSNTTLAGILYKLNLLHIYHPRPLILSIPPLVGQIKPIHILLTFIVAITDVPVNGI
jgi:prepilin-type N-terminal cleavage/methylation domain-containing protein